MKRNIGAAWRDRSAVLAEWVDRLLVNRRDVWGAFIPLARRREPDLKSWTAPRKDDRGLVTLTQETIRRHFVGRCVDDLIGLHTTSPALTSRFGAYDLDNHGDDAAKRAANVDITVRLLAALHARGAHAMIERACDRGGLHLWILFAEPAPTPAVFAFLSAVVADAGLPEGSVETYPKQARPPLGADGRRRFGNWLRLPGRHHTRDWWSEVRRDGRWLSGHDAITSMIAHPLMPLSILPTVQELPSETPTVARSAPLVAAAGSVLERRIAAYIAKLPTGMRKGTGRNDVAYTLAAWLVRDLNLADRDAESWLRVWNHDQADPLSDDKITSLIAEAHEYGRHGYGAGLEERAS